MLPASRECLASSASTNWPIKPLISEASCLVTTGTSSELCFFFFSCCCCLQTGMGPSPLIKGWAGTVWCLPSTVAGQIHNVKRNVLMERRRIKSFQDWTISEAGAASLKRHASGVHADWQKHYWVVSCFALLWKVSRKLMKLTPWQFSPRCSRVYH